MILTTHPTARSAWRRRRAQLTRSTLAPPPRLSLSEWADRYRRLSRENSASPGKFRTSVVPYLKGIMDACTDKRIREVVVMKAAQVAFTDGVVNNLVGFHIDQDPAPILVVQISVDEAEKWSKEKLAPMLRDTPRLRGKVTDAKSRISDNTILAKSYPGGHLGIVGANAPSGLRARPRRVIIFDEIDGYPDSSGTEGDPIALGEKRATTFWNRKILKGSTPTLKGASKIEREFDRSDQRKYYVPCPHCGTKQILVFKNLVWDKEGEGSAKVHRPETAAYRCEDCAALIVEADKGRMLAAGEWVAENPGHDDRPTGFHISALYSPFMSWKEIVQEFLKAKNVPELLKVWTNTVLGESYEEHGEKVDPDALMQRREPYGAEVPSFIGVLTLAVDVQGDRLEYKVKGYGADEESALIARGQIMGDPGDTKSQLSVWRSIDVLLDKSFQHEDGATLRIAAAAIDSGGHHYDAVCRYAKGHQGRNVFAIKGSSEGGKPIWPLKPVKNNKHGVRLYMVGTDTAKDLILGSRIRRASPGPGFMHFPLTVAGEKVTFCDDEYFKQLTSEKKIRKLVKGRWVHRWEPTRDRNEALDLEVYCFAALNGLGPVVLKNLGVHVEKIRADGAALKTPPAEQDQPSPFRPKRRGSSWATGGGSWG